MNRAARLFLGFAAAWLAMSGPAQAQFSAGYKFLEAVRKKDGEKVDEALGDPGSTVVNTRDVSTGETALHIVTARRDLTWMTFLIQKGGNVNARDNRGVTALVLATSLGFHEGAELLLGQKARLDDSNDAGETPLISAVHRRDIEMMRLLLKAGADPDRADNSGRTARDYAKLSVNSSSLLSEIETSAKPKSQRAGAKATYGPSF